MAARRNSVSMRQGEKLRAIALAGFVAALARQSAFQRIGLFGHPAPIAREVLKRAADSFIGGERCPALAIFRLP
jgi:hypothetical protein